MTDRAGQCPACGSTEITGDSIDIVGPWARQEVSCDVCGSYWTDQYYYDGPINLNNIHKLAHELRKETV